MDHKLVIKLVREVDKVYEQDSAELTEISVAKVLFYYRDFKLQDVVNFSVDQVQVVI